MDDYYRVDGTADLDDIDGLVLALRAPAQYEVLYGLPPSLLADTDGDGDLDFDDIPGFVAALNGTALTAGSAAAATGAGLGADTASGALGPDAANRVPAEEVGGWIADQAARTAPAAAVELDETLAPAADLEGDLEAAVAPVFLGRQRAGQDWASRLRSRARHPADPLAATDEELAAVWSANEDWLEWPT
ncbi:MAG: hypothetical protein ACC645_18260 [Pirellulales bacterium]